MERPYSIEYVPLPMQVLRRWVGWIRTERGQLLPLCPRTGKAASSTDVKTWGTLDEALGLVARKKAHGVGYMVGDGITAIDLDWKGSATVPTWAEGIIERLDSYTELSPSGQGAHVFVLGEASRAGMKRKMEGGSIEIYSRHRFIRITGWLWQGEIKELQWRHETLQSIEHELWPPVVPAAIPPVVAVGDDDAVWQKLMNMRGRLGDIIRRLAKGDLRDFLDASPDGADLSRADFVLAKALVRFVGKDYERVRALMERFPIRREKWERKGYLERTIDAAWEMHHAGY